MLLSQESEIIVVVHSQPIVVEMYVYNHKEKSMTPFYHEAIKGASGLDSLSFELIQATHVKFKGSSYIVIAQTSGY